MIYPIFIPSKGRSSTAKTPALLHEAGIAFSVCIEPQEVEEYSKTPWNLTVIGKNNGGIAYARQWILNCARERELPWYWMFDDDISGFFVTLPAVKKTVKASPKEVLLKAQEIFSPLAAHLAIGGLEYQQFAWGAAKPFTQSSYAEVAVCINTANTRGLSYDAAVAGKEDRDFVLQCLRSGKISVRSTWTSFSCPKNGTNKGGLSETFYKAGKEVFASKALANKWPGVVEFKMKNDGRPDAKVHWRKCAAQKPRPGPANPQPRA